MAEFSKNIMVTECHQCDKIIFASIIIYIIVRSYYVLF